MIDTICFDLDGTLLNMDQEEFIKAYFSSLAQHFASYGYDPKLILAAVIQGTKAMVTNDGKVSNETVFWNTFTSVSKIDFKDVEKEFNDFYENIFPNLKSFTRANKDAPSCIRILKEKGYRLILATNPLFPSIATQMRIRWGNLNPNDFDCITTYENCSTCKPNPAYYKEIMTKMHLDPEKCIHAGNDVNEDGCIETLGVPCYLITDDLINTQNKPLSMHWHGTFEEFLKICENLPQVH